MGETGKTIYEKLTEIQNKLNVPKNQYNSFGNYNYRSAEDIQEAVKPHLKEHGLSLVLYDELVMVGERYYIRSVARLEDGKDKIEVPSYAREEENKKGMDGSQITGASSSYARKYALGGMFLIDDSKDADATNNGKDQKKPPAKKPEPVPAEKLVCDNKDCAKKITQAEYDYSVKKYKRPFCRDCQKKIEEVKKPKKEEIDINDLPIGEE